MRTDYQKNLCVSVRIRVPPKRSAGMTTQTERLTMAQALVTFLKNQYVERDGVENPFFAGCFGIFGHGNVAGVGQALHGEPRFSLLPGAQRAGPGAHGGGLCQDQEPPANLRLHLVDRSRRDQHDHRRGGCDHQPPAGAAAARRHLCPAQRGAGAAAARVGVQPGYLGQRLLQAGLRAIGTGSTARNSCSPPCRKRCAC